MVLYRDVLLRRIHHVLKEGHTLTWAWNMLPISFCLFRLPLADKSLFWLWKNFSGATGRGKVDPDERFIKDRRRSAGGPRLSRSPATATFPAGLCMSLKWGLLHEMSAVKACTGPATLTT